MILEPGKGLEPGDLALVRGDDHEPSFDGHIVVVRTFFPLMHFDGEGCFPAWSVDLDGYESEEWIFQVRVLFPLGKPHFDLVREIEKEVKA